VLGWHPGDPEESIRRSVAWHLAHPPAEPDPGFSGDDAALAPLPAAPAEAASAASQAAAGLRPARADAEGWLRDRGAGVKTRT
jgi:hypothetical protein